MKTVVSTVFSEGANGLALQGFSSALKRILKLPLLFFFFLLRRKQTLSCAIQMQASTALLQPVSQDYNFVCERVSQVQPDAEENNPAVPAQIRALPLPLRLAAASVPKMLRPGFQGKGINFNQQRQ